MNIITRLLLTLSICICPQFWITSSGIAQQPEGNPSVVEFRFTSEHKSTTIPFELFNNHVVLPANLDSQGLVF
jgi:hypothetical protein